MTEKVPQFETARLICMAVIKKDLAQNNLDPQRPKNDVYGKERLGEKVEIEKGFLFFQTHWYFADSLNPVCTHWFSLCAI